MKNIIAVYAVRQAGSLRLLRSIFARNGMGIQRVLGKKGGWKAAGFGKLVGHTTEEMDQ